MNYFEILKYLFESLQIMFGHNLRLVEFEKFTHNSHKNQNLILCSPKYTSKCSFDTFTIFDERGDHVLNCR